MKRIRIKKEGIQIAPDAIPGLEKESAFGLHRHLLKFDGVEFDIPFDKTVQGDDAEFFPVDEVKDGLFYLGAFPVSLSATRVRIILFGLFPKSQHIVVVFVTEEQLGKLTKNTLDFVREKLRNWGFNLC